MVINFLRKLFIKDYNNVNNPKVREKHGLLATSVGIVTNLLLFIAKIIIGVITMTFSIITDAINNLSDMTSCILSLVGFKLASKPADKKHPFGHQRIEYITALIVSLVIIILAVIMGYTSVMKIINKEATKLDTYVVFIILGLSILLKLWQSFFYKKMSKLINSVALKANSQDSLNDCISTSAILLITIVLYVWGDKIPYSYLIDPIVGIALSVFIIVTGIKLVIETCSPLIGSSLDETYLKPILEDIKSYKGVYGVHDVMGHSYGPTTMFMSLHVEVDHKVDVLESHELIDNIENEIGKKYNIHLTIHMDPIVIDSPIISKLRTYIECILKEYSKVDISFHDLRVVEGKGHTNVIFDIAIPFESGIDDNDIVKYLSNKIKEYNNKYNSVIKIDRI